MTIQSDWIKAFKSSFPQCFTSTTPFKPSTVFIDGQIVLMRTVHAHSWSQLIFSYFVKPIMQQYANGATTVILAFDDYTHVPETKAATQAKRVKNVPVIDFHAASSLPDHIPPNYQQCLANRTFKTKLIMLIVDLLPSHIKMHDNQTLIMDFHDRPYVLTKKDGLYRSDKFTEPLGEADVKAMRYLDEYPDLMIHSIDGDSVPIAMLKTEDLVSQNIHRPLAIYRMVTNTSKAPKRSSDGKHKIQYEYVNINKLTECLTKRLNNLSPNHRPIRALSILIGMTGTDFTDGMPRITAAYVWGKLALVWQPFASLLDDQDVTGTNYQQIADRVIAPLYASKFKLHTTHSRNLEKLCTDLKASALAESVRNQIPSAQALVALVKQSVWVYHYWHFSVPVGNPEEFGWKYTEQGRLTHID